MMLMVCPVIQSSMTALSRANGNVQDDDQRAAPVAQEDQHHQAGEGRAQQAFEDQASKRIGHDRRLVELKADVHVFRERPGGMRGWLLFTALITAIVEASERLVTGM